LPVYPAVLHGGGARRRGGMRSGRVGAGRRLAEQGHSVAIMDKNPRPSGACPADWPGTTVVGSRASTATTSTGRGGQAERPGRGDERGQLEHPHGPDRPGDLRDRQRGGPDLRPPAGRDLPAPGHPHRGHRDLDDRPGPAPAAARDVTGEWTDATGQLVLVETSCPRPGPASASATSGSRDGPTWWPSPGPASPGSTSPPGGPGGRRPPYGRHEGRHGRPRTQIELRLGSKPVEAPQDARGGPP
jgi:hypothetical protein